MSPPTVLLADDDDAFRRTLRRVLVQQGYEVIDVADGASALELLAEAADGARPEPDVVILDVMMPGCSGLGILSAMRRFERRPATFLLTAFSDPSVQVVARRFGAQGVLHKPIDLDEVLEMVARAASNMHPSSSNGGTLMELRQIMTEDVLTFSPRQPASDAVATMRDAGVRHAVVTTRGNVAGIISDRDLGGPYGGALRRGRTVEELMRPLVRHAEPDMPVDQAALLMRKEHLGCLPVLERGQLVGIVTRGDLLEALATGRKRRRARVADESPRAPRMTSPNRDKWP